MEALMPAKTPFSGESLFSLGGSNFHAKWKAVANHAEEEFEDLEFEEINFVDEAGQHHDMLSFFRDMDLEEAVDGQICDDVAEKMPGNPDEEEPDADDPDGDEE
jgi:hypothetical protein